MPSVVINDSIATLKQGFQSPFSHSQVTHKHRSTPSEEFLVRTAMLLFTLSTPNL